MSDIYDVEMLAAATNGLCKKLKEEGYSGAISCQILPLREKGDVMEGVIVARVTDGEHSYTMALGWEQEKLHYPVSEKDEVEA